MRRLELTADQVSQCLHPLFEMLQQVLESVKVSVKSVWPESAGVVSMFEPVGCLRSRMGCQTSRRQEKQLTCWLEIEKK
jgi:hypothetical protein